jgi:hypothetical protein
LKPVDVFTTISSGKQALHNKLEENPGVQEGPITHIEQKNVPTIFKERNPAELIFNTILIAHFPHLISPQLSRDILTAFLKMMDARKLEAELTEQKKKSNRKKKKATTGHKDTRSNLGSEPLHLGIWEKQANDLNLTAATRSENEEVCEATLEFLQQVGKIAELLLPIMEELCPHLMERHHKYVLFLLTHPNLIEN